MKYFVFSALLCLSLYAQTPSTSSSSTAAPSAAATPGDTTPASKVVAKIDGRDVTAGEIRAALKTVPDDLVKLYQQNPKYAIQQMYLLHYLAAEGEKNKLAEESPLKEQLEATRANMVAGAMLTYQQNHYVPPAADVAAFYETNKTKFQRVKTSAILINFTTPLGPNATVDERARAQAEQAMGRSRSEEDAHKRAEEVIAKIRAGGDFAKLVEEYSDDPTSKSKGGDLGFVTLDSQHADAIKKAVFALQPGQVSDPIRLNGLFAVIRAEDKSIQPQSDAELFIQQQLRSDHMKQWFRELTVRFDPVLEDPSFFPQPAPIPGKTGVNPQTAAPNGSTPPASSAPNAPKN